MGEERERDRKLYTIFIDDLHIEQIGWFINLSIKTI